MSQSSTIPSAVCAETTDAPAVGWSGDLSVNAALSLMREVQRLRALAAQRQAEQEMKRAVQVLAEVPVCSAS